MPTVDDEDELYDGFGDERSSALAPLRGAADRGQGRLGTAMGGPPGTAAGQLGGPRPLTSVKGVGFQARGPGRDGGSRLSGPAPPLAERGELSPVDEAREMEARVHALLEASADAAYSKGDAQLALERAKEAGRKERALEKFLENSGLAGSDALPHSQQLTYAVAFNLATALHGAKQWTEALAAYGVLAKNKAFGQGARLRVNMGNVHYEQAQYPAAIKQYRMALDLLPNTAKETRLRVHRNVGHAFVAMGGYTEAIPSYEAVMDASPEMQAGFNLLMCYYALGDTDMMRKGFVRLLSVPLPVSEEEGDGKGEGEDGALSGRDDDALFAHMHVARDALHEELAERQRASLGFVLTASKLVAPVLDASSWVSGYDWVIGQLEVDHPTVASEMAIARALGHLARKNFTTAIEELKAFEKKGVSFQARAAVNLSFLYLLEGDLPQAGKYASLAVKTDRYNARALVNMGNCLLEDRGDVDRAKELYLEAIGVEADCCEAIYNLGLVNKQTGAMGEALQAFEKLHTLVPSSPEVLYQLASLHAAVGNVETAVKYMKYLAGRLPNDPGVLARLGALHSKDAEGEAFHYHAESYRVWPVDLEVLSWLGVWYVEAELYEKAVEFFERAAEVQPSEPKWKIMVASCHRRSGATGRAIAVYEDIHAAHPENVECLRYLVALCRETRRRAEHYEAALARLDRAAGLMHDAPMAYEEEGGPTSGPSAESSRAGSARGGQPPDVAGGALLPSFAAPSGASGLRGGAGGGQEGGRAQAKQEDDFADADIDDLLG